jgi:hypothetical protein
VAWPWQLLIALALGLAAEYLYEQSGMHIASGDSKDFIWWPLIEERTGWIPWIPVSVLVFWRWAWVLLHWTRAIIYKLVRYPALRRDAERAVISNGPVPELAVLAVTYKEDPNITRAVFRSVFEEIGRVDGLERRALVVAVTGCDEDDAGIRAARAEASIHVPPERLAELVLLRGCDGKRRALAAGLEYIKTWQTRTDGAFICMDGDTQLEPGVISRSLGFFFRLDPPIAALTTNEHVIVQGPGWFLRVAAPASRPARPLRLLDRAVAAPALPHRPLLDVPRRRARSGLHRDRARRPRPQLAVGRLRPALRRRQEHLVPPALAGPQHALPARCLGGHPRDHQGQTPSSARTTTSVAGAAT